jgi:hypothetical protein
MRTGVLCSAIAFLTAFGACGGQPPKMVHCDRDLTCVKQAIVQGLAYTRNCAGEYPTGTIYGKEVKVCGDAKCRADLGQTPDSCIAFGAGGSDLMVIGFQDVTWPAGAWSSTYGISIGGQTLDSQRPVSFALKAADFPVPPTTNSDVEFYLNTQFGGGCAGAWHPSIGWHSACMRFGIAQTHYGVFQGDRPRSLEFNRWCGINQNGSGVSC